MRRPSGYALFFRAGSANNARNVNTDGTLNRNNAYNGNNGLPPRPMNEWDYADGWVLKGDFSKFFYTLLHSYCYETARRALKWLKDPELIDFAEWLL